MSGFHGRGYGGDDKELFDRIINELVDEGVIDVAHRNFEALLMPGTEKDRCHLLVHNDTCRNIYLPSSKPFGSTRYVEMIKFDTISNGAVCIESRLSTPPQYS
jgi:hypothetical protein